MKDRPLTDFDKTVLEQMERIRAIGRKHLRDQNELDDFVQETVARAYANRSQLRDPAKLKPWIAGVARNTANEWNRAFYRKRREQPLPDEIDIPDERNPLDALEQAERNEQIRQALNRLNPVDRDLLRGRYMDEESYEALQDRHGLSYSAVGIRLHRAKRRLKKILNGMKIALVLPFASLKRSAFGGILLMTKSTKIVFGVIAVLILALLGAYLWLGYGGSPDDAEPALTVEEQSPRVHTRVSTDAGGASTQTDAPTSGGAAQPSETTQAGASGVKAETTAAAPSEAADAPDDFSIEFQEAVDEMKAFAKKAVAEFPEFFYEDTLPAMILTLDNFLKCEVELRQERLTVEERKMRLREQALADFDIFEKSMRSGIRVYRYVEELSGIPADTTMLVVSVERMRSMSQFFAESAPRKLAKLLDLPEEMPQEEEDETVIQYRYKEPEPNNR